MTLLKNRSLLLTFCLLTLLPIAGWGQYKTAVDWHTPDNEAKAIQQLERFHELGISIIKVRPPISSPIWAKINELDFQVYGDLDIKFPITETFSQPDSSLLNKIRNRSRLLLKQNSVVAVGLFSFGPIHNRQFLDAVKPYFRELQKAEHVDIYFMKSMRQNIPIDSIAADVTITNVQINRQNINQLNLRSYSAGFYKFSPSKELSNYLKPFYLFLKAVPVNSTIFVNSSWLLSALESFPSFKTTLKSFGSNSGLIFPLPEETLPPKDHSPIPIILLVILWGSVALHYNFSPLYRKSVFRYFTAHKFFVDDIFRRHIRTPVPALILILQHSLVMGAIFFTAASALFTPLGMDALYSFIGQGLAYNSSPIGLAILGALLSTALSFTSILWLYFGSKKVKSITQTATLYSWLLHANFLIGTVLISFYSSGGGETTIILLASLAVLVQIASFILTSFDSSRFIIRRRMLYLFLTSGIYLIIILCLLTWIYFSEDIQEILSLANRL